MYRLLKLILNMRVEIQKYNLINVVGSEVAFGRDYYLVMSLGQRSFSNYMKHIK